MVKGKNIIGLSRDYVIHLGETLTEVMQDKEITSRALAVRTGTTETHVNMVLHGQKDVFVTFAGELEAALGIEKMFWMNLQSNYDRELLAVEHSIIWRK